MRQADVSYQAIQVDNSDEATSLASYLNEHGIAAFAQEGPEVNVPLVLGDMDSYEKLALLTKSWRWFWEYSDSGLMGLPMYVKED